MANQGLPERMSEEAICSDLLDIGSLSFRDVDGDLGDPEDPYLYSSGNYGPVYIDVKGSVGVQDMFKRLVQQVALRVVETELDFDWIAGNATGGMIPAYELREAYQDMTGREVGYNYIRGSRKVGGKGELITGLQHVPKLRPDGTPTSWLVLEELVNFADTTANSAEILRGEGFTANHGATILTYDHDPQRQRLAAAGMDLVYAARVDTLIGVARETRRFNSILFERRDEFQADPAAWMAVRGLQRVDMGK